jgi:hypothetical protein
MTRISYKNVNAGLLVIAALVLAAFVQVSCTGAGQLKESPKASPAEKGASPKVMTPEPGSSGQGEMSAQPDFGNGGGSQSPGNQPGPNGTSPAPEGPESGGVTLPKGWPTDIPIMPEFKINFSANKGDGGLLVGASGKNSVTEVADFYKKMEGWAVLSDSITNPTQSKPGRSIVLTRKDATLSIVVESSKTGTQLNLTFRRS